MNGLPISPWLRVVVAVVCIGVLVYGAVDSGYLRMGVGEKPTREGAVRHVLGFEHVSGYDYVCTSLKPSNHYPGYSHGATVEWRAPDDPSIYYHADLAYNESEREWHLRDLTHFRRGYGIRY